MQKFVIGLTLALLIAITGHISYWASFDEPIIMGWSGFIIPILCVVSAFCFGALLKSIPD